MLPDSSQQHLRGTLEVDEASETSEGLQVVGVKGPTTEDDHPVGLAREGPLEGHQTFFRQARQTLGLEQMRQAPAIAVLHHAIDFGQGQACSRDDRPACGRGPRAHLAAQHQGFAQAQGRVGAVVVLGHV